MIFDNHMHTIFSSDSTMKIEEVLEESKKQNLGILLTEHLDLDYPDPDMFRLDVQNYFKTYESYRSATLGLGIEIGMNSDFLQEYTRVVNSNNFDFVIGSVHSIDGHDMSLDFFKVASDKHALYLKYFETMEKDVKDFDCFDALGHIDYPCRYAPYEDKEIHLEVYKEYIDRIFIELLNKGKILELNTRTIGDKKRYASLHKIYTRYKELGGKYVTLGSDAHGKTAIGINFKIAHEFVDSIGLKEVHFENRIMKI